MIERILEIELSLDPKDVASWGWYVGVLIAAYKKVCMC